MEYYRLSQWSGILQERAASGRNIKELCLQAGIHVNTYFYWQRKLRNVASKGLVGDASNEVTETLETGLVPKG
jgi:transposase-like protein